MPSKNVLNVLLSKYSSALKPFMGGLTWRCTFPHFIVRNFSPNPPRGGVTAAGWAMSGKGGRWFGQDFG